MILFLILSFRGVLLSILHQDVHLHLLLSSLKTCKDSRSTYLKLLSLEHYAFHEIGCIKKKAFPMSIMQIQTTDINQMSEDTLYTFRTSNNFYIIYFDV